MGNNLFTGKVINRSEIGLTEGKLELGDVGAQLLPRTSRREVATDDIGETLPHIPLVGVVPVIGPLTAYTARPIWRIIFKTVLSAMRTPSSARRHMATCL